MADPRPEGTDRIVSGNADTSTAGPAGGGGPSANLGEGAGNTGGSGGDGGDLKARAQAKADELRGQAGDKARDYVEQGKDRATGALDEVARMISDNAAQLDDTIGAQYGDYARRAADYVSGFSDAIRDKDVDELVDDARALIRRAPGVAIGAGAAAGFALARIVKAGSEALEETARSYDATGRKGGANGGRTGGGTAV